MAEDRGRLSAKAGVKPPAEEESVASKSERETPPRRCPSCRRGYLVLIDSRPRPSWRHVLGRNVQAGDSSRIVDAGLLSSAARGLTPHDHLGCASEPRASLGKSLDGIGATGRRLQARSGANLLTRAFPPRTLRTESGSPACSDFFGALNSTSDAGLAEATSPAMCAPRI